MKEDIELREEQKTIFPVAPHNRCSHQTLYSVSHKPHERYADANAKLYQYYGGTSGAVDVVLPNQLGYIPFTVPAIVSIQPGQLIHVRLESPDGAVNPIDTLVLACQKGSVGCE